MGCTHLFALVNAILAFTQIINIAAEDTQSHLLGRLLTPEDGCGVSKVPSKKIIGGSETLPGEYPWMALLFYLVERDFGTVVETECGGSLITSRHVLTAAHCLRPFEGFVRLGEHDVTVDDGKNQDIYVSFQVKHPDFGAEFKQANDIAILFLEYDVLFNDRVRPICLPLSEELQSRSFSGSNPFIAGWGTLDPEKDLMSDVLMHVQLPIIDNEQCKNLYSVKKKRIAENEFGDNVICTGYLEGGKDSCFGDSGGPLMIPILNNGTFNTYQIGVLSCGMGCAQKNTPGVCMKVQNYIDWIKKTVNHK